MQLDKWQQMLVAVTLLGASGCGGSNSPAEAPGVQAIANAQQRILGSWRLVSFQPEQPFGPPFDQLVAQHVGQMLVTFDSGTLTTSNGFEVTRNYEILSANADAAEAVVSDSMGVKYDFDLFFTGEQLSFVSQTSPWRGQGILGRVQP
jgi:hypothetical protein